MSGENRPIQDPLFRTDTVGFRAWWGGLYLFYHMSMTLGFSLRMQGQHNMPKAGPVLVIANHQSFLDPIVIALSVGQPLVYLARKTLFRHRIFAALIRSLNAVPIDQEGVGKEGLRVVVEQLQLGKGVVVFPEGERTPDGKMQKFQPGIHLILKRVQVPIVPVGIAGAYDAWPIWRKYPILAPLFLPAASGTIAVSVGKPFDIARHATMSRSLVMQELFERVQDEQRRAEKQRRR